MSTKAQQQQQQQKTSLLSLPPELILDSLSLVPYTPTHLQNLRLINRHFNTLLQTYEHSLSSEILTLQFPPRCLQRFPSVGAATTTALQKKKAKGNTTTATTSYEMLDRLATRLHTLHRIQETCYEIVDREGKQAPLMTPTNISLLAAGLLLLYRLKDNKSHEAKLHLLNSLPPTSLATLLFALTLSIQILRFRGPEILHRHSPVQIPVFRSEIELVAQEMLLHHGPDFLYCLLSECPGALRILNTEHTNLEEKQFPLPNGNPRPRTLIAELRRALASATGNGVADNETDMWAVLDVIGGDVDDDGVVEGIVWGFDCGEEEAGEEEGDEDSEEEEDSGCGKRKDSAVGLVAGSG